MKKASRRELAKTITRQLLGGTDSKHLIDQVAAYLVQHKMASQADRLLQDVSAELQAATGHVSATVVTAFNLGSDSTHSLRDAVQHLTGATEVELDLQEDKDLVGGVVIKMPGRELDASVRRKLKLLATGGVN